MSHLSKDNNDQHGHLCEKKKLPKNNKRLLYSEEKWSNGKHTRNLADWRHACEKTVFFIHE